MERLWLWQNHRYFYFLVFCFASHAGAQIQSQVQFFNDTFLSPAFEATQQNQYQFLGLKLKNAEEDEGLFQLDSEGAFAAGAPLMSYTKVNELFFQIPAGQGQKLELGRHKVNWSELDTRWNFGVWQPIFKWNPLSPESQGLTGLFWNYENSWSELTFFASPVYLPNQGPSFEINDQGEFVRGHPWFRRPPSYIRVLDEVSKVEYNFEKPSESSVVAQSSYSARVRIKNDEGSRAQLSYAYKPMNNLSLAYVGLLDIAKDRGVVNIQPYVDYHSVLGVDGQWARKNWKLGVSMIADRPEPSSERPENKTYPEMQAAQLYSAYIDFDLKYIQLSLETLEVFNGDVVDRGEDASSQRVSISNRYLFTQAQRASLKNIFLIRKGRRVATELSLTQSQKNDFQLIQAHSYLQFSKMWSAFADLQLVRAQIEMSVNKQNEIAQYANNDKISLGISYVF